MSQLAYSYERDVSFHSKTIRRRDHRLTRRLTNRDHMNRPLQNFATKLCIFSNFKMLFLTVVMDFILLARNKNLFQHANSPSFINYSLI